MYFYLVYFYFYLVGFMLMLTACQLSSPEHPWPAKLVVAMFWPLTFVVVCVGVCVRVIKEIGKSDE